MALHSQHIVASVLALVLSACGTPVPQPEQEASAAKLEPAKLGPEGSLPILFEHIVFRIPSGQRIGTRYFGARKGSRFEEIRWQGSSARTLEFNVQATDRLRQHGYTAVDPTDTLFEAGQAQKTRLRLGGVVTSIGVELFLDRVHSKNNRSEVQIDVEMRLFDAVTQEELYRQSFEARGVDVGSEANGISLALMNALDQLVADPNFAKAATNGEAPIENGEAAQVLAIPRCPAGELSLPLDFEQVKQAVVTLLVGGGGASGVVVSQRGDVLTAAHVVSGLERVTVQLATGIQLEASVVRLDKANDAALVRLPGAGYACRPPRSGPVLPMGADVFAIGSLSRELTLSVSRGVVSGNRNVEGIDYIQTDASVNPGSSGGPLLDDRGAIAGIVVRKIVAQGYEGLAFGIPIDRVVERLGIAWE